MLTLIGTLFGFLGSGVPIGIALGAASALFILFDPLLDTKTISRSFFAFLGNYSLMAVPFFIYAGFLMERTGLVRQLFQFAESLLSWVPGGFGVATVATCVMFAAISGSSVAVASAMSLIAIPEMKQRKYPDWLSAGIVSSGGGIGLLIPPSLSLILYGIVTETSIVRLFFGGIIPGLLLAGGMFTLIAIAAWRSHELGRGRFDLGGALRNAKGAAAGLAMPLLVLGGLYGGLFTPTEAGAAACGYALLYGLLTGRRAFLRQLLPVTARAANLTAIVFFLVGSVGIFQFVAANQFWPQKLAQQVVALELGALPFLFGYLGLLLVLGMFLDGVAMILLTVPVVFPIAMALGIDTIHLGVLVTLAVELSVITPPVGFNLYAVSGIANIPIQTVLKGAFIFFWSDLIVTILILLLPVLVTWLPDLLISPIAFGG